MNIGMFRGFIFKSMFVLSLTSQAYAVAPVMDREMADPFIHKSNDGIYILIASNNMGENVPMYSNRAPGVEDWTRIGDAMPDLPSWAVKGRTWAPEIIRLGENYLLYFSARHRLLGIQCIGVAQSKELYGKYKPVGDTPLICDANEGGSIAGHPFVDTDGTPYLLWKTEGNVVNRKTWINIAHLGPSGLNVVGPKHKLIKNDQAWEKINVEAPFLVKRNNLYYLFYSGAMFSTENYAIGYAVSNTVTGPYIKSQANPIVKSSRQLGYGPGTETIFVDDCGKSWLGYAAYSDSRKMGKNGKRQTRIIGLEWINNEPVILPNADIGECYKNRTL